MNCFEEVHPRRSFSLALTLGVLPLLGFWLYGLFDLDEGYYGAVVAEMNRRGEWITPYFNGKPWFEKPILLYWFAKPSVSLFGEAIGPRLPSVLATMGLLAMCGFYLRKRATPQAGLWVMAMLGTSLIVIAIGRMMITDALLDLCVCGAFLSFYESLVGKRAWRLLTAFCLGLAVLAKGPVSLPLFLAVAIWTYLSESDLRSSFNDSMPINKASDRKPISNFLFPISSVRWWLLGIVILAATVCMWYVPAYLENGHVFVQKFFVEQNLQRFGGGDEAHKVPLLLWPIYYPAILFAGLLPWSIWLPKQWRAAFKPDADPFARYLARWAAVVLVFFTISGTKLPHYILPAVPPLIMIAALDRAKTQPAAWRLWGALSVVFCLLANGVFVFWYQKSGFAEVHGDAKLINQMVKGRGTVLTYQLARVANAKGLSLNDTSNPSLGFYLDQNRLTFTDTSNMQELKADLVGASGDVFVLTRPARLSPSDLISLSKNGFSLQEQEPLSTSPKYLLFRVSRGPSSS